MPATTATASGTVKLRLRLSKEVFRQASSGPAPVRKRSIRPIGTATRLKNGGPTVTVLLSTAFEMIGKIVTHSTAKTSAKRIQLLKRNPLSREITESSRFSLFRKSSRKNNKVSETRAMTAKKPAK